jgi:hypothetical protein
MWRKFLNSRCDSTEQRFVSILFRLKKFQRNLHEPIGTTKSILLFSAPTNAKDET